MISISRKIIIINIERKGMQLSLAKGNIMRVTLYRGSVIFTKAASMIFCLPPIMSVRMNLPRIIHMAKDNV
jgi:hypothetical protein